RIFPDGGVARLRIHGDVVVDWVRLAKRGDVDLAAAEHGGLVVACSDMFFGSRHNLIMPGDARNMGDGWETRRRRGPGFDWTIVRLGAVGEVRRIDVDTRHFKGNAPGACSLDGCSAADANRDRLAAHSGSWRPLLARTPLQSLGARYDRRPPVPDRRRVVCCGGCDMARSRIGGLARSVRGASAHWGRWGRWGGWGALVFI